MTEKECWEHIRELEKERDALDVNDVWGRRQINDRIGRWKGKIQEIRRDATEEHGRGTVPSVERPD